MTVPAATTARPAPFLQTINRKPVATATATADPAPAFPYHLPFVQQWQPLELDGPITFLVGENGSGKSTLLESVACVANATAVGSDELARDATLADVQVFARAFVALSWRKRAARCLFLRAEDFFGYAKRMAQLQSELRDELTQIDHEYRDRSAKSQGLARMAHKRELGALHQSYGEGLDANSHGEGFFKLFRARFVGAGLYLLDEPEAALSPTRQMALLVLLRDLIAQGAQFIIATHAPILLAYPQAQILSFGAHGIRPAAYETLEHVTLTRAFLNDPQTYLRHLLG
jgi:predicted ATPase